MKTARLLVPALLLLLAACGGMGGSEKKGSISRLSKIDPTLSIEEQLLRIPGVFRNENGEIRIRGSVGAPLLVVDDQPLMSPDLDFLNPADVEEIEVLKGPATAIYGSRGGGGVIRITTKRPPEQE